MALLLCGIDEAGYGPLLGPLCVGASIVRVDEWSPGDEAPDLWRLLGRAISRGPSRAKRPRKIAIGDSKALKLPNTSIRRHPLFHLERGVLACLRCAGHAAATDAALLACLGAALGDRAWYGGAPINLPLGCGAAQCGIDANVLMRALTGAGSGFTHLACSAVPEHAFNAHVRRSGSKASAEAPAIGAHMRMALRAAGEGDSVRIVCDRLGGRMCYAGLLEELLEADVDVLEETARRSRYVVRADGREARVMFVPEAESAHMPVALASMIAKYVRELAMMRFNRYWCARRAELKPTAGYTTDARRWLADADVTSEERAALVRIA